MLVVVVVVGCVSGPKLPQYVPPKLPKDQVAILKGHGGTTVISIDQAEVKGSGIQMGNFGGNHVILAAGTRRIVVSQASSSSTSFSSSTMPFEFDFQGGHVYRVGPRGTFNREMELHDETSG